jgi:putative ribosome biogenesis GTPase RsgA
MSESFEITQDIEDVELEITKYRFPDEVIKNGLFVKDDVPVILTISNHGFDDFNLGDMLQIRQEKDAFFATSTLLMKGLNVPSNGEAEFSFLIKVQNEIETLQNLPNHVDVKIINKKRDIIAKTTITVPIRLYVLGLKRRYNPINVFLFGQVGMGKSSFVNTVATVFNENDDFSVYVQRITAAQKSTVSLTQSLQSFKFGNLRIFDTWGWQSSEEDSNNSYTEEFFELILQGVVPENTELKYAKELLKDIGQFEDQSSKNKIDVVIFFLTPMDVNQEYLKLIQRFQGVCSKNKVKTMALLTQIDLVNEEFENDPYTNNAQPLEELLNKVSNDTSLAKVDIKPIVNYVNTNLRTWALDKACFIPISHCFMIAETAREQTENN